MAHKKTRLSALINLKLKKTNFLILLLSFLLIHSTSCSFRSKKKKKTLADIRAERKMRLLSNLTSREIKNLTHETNRNNLFKNSLSLSDLYESHKRKTLLTPFPPLLGNKQTPYGFELTLPLGGTDPSGQDHRWCTNCKTFSCCPNWKRSPGEKGRPIKFLLQLKKWKRFSNEPPFKSFYAESVLPGSVGPLKKNIVSFNIPYSGYEFNNFLYFLKKANRKLLYRFRVKSWLPLKPHQMYKQDYGRWSLWSPASYIIGWNPLKEKWQKVKLVKKGLKIQRVNFGPFYE